MEGVNNGKDGKSQMSLPYQHKLIPRARELRKNATRQENHLWYDFLRSYPVRFQRQKTIGCYITDFYCHAAKLVIELDGSQHFTKEAIEYDRQRSSYLQGCDLKILRFTNYDIDRHFPNICQLIHQEVQQRLSEVTSYD